MSFLFCRSFENQSFPEEGRSSRNFQSETWDGDSILELLNRYAVTPETFSHHLGQILLKIFKITELRYLRFEFLVGRNDIQLTKESNMPRTLVPSVVRLNEHYCRRWIPVSLLQVLEGKR